jgi:MYXO-CTERM domain-containing protein
MPARRRVTRAAGPAVIARTARLAAVLGLLLLIAIPGATPASAQAAENEIDGTAALKWEPANLQIDPGDTVTFKISGSPPHPVGPDPTSADKFEAPDCQIADMSKVGDSCEVKFDKAGTFAYECTIHAAVGMKGVITVGKPSGETPPANGGGAATPTPSASPDTPTAATSPPGKPGIYYAGWGLLAVGGIVALAAIAGYLRIAPDFNRQRK